MDQAQPTELEIKVPGSIANLGPGFDTLAVAVQLYLRLHVRHTGGQNELTFEFLNQKLDGENYIERAFRFLARQQGGSFPSLSVQVLSDIPMKGGLGSSAAATVAGLRLYEAIMAPMPAQGLLNAACNLEGHPDNVAAALLGGLTASCQLSDGSAFAVRLRWPESLGVVVLTPETTLATAAARRVLPQRIPRADAIFNLQRVALLLQALQTSNFSLLREAFQDRLHQPYREVLVPGLKEALSLEHPDLLGVCLSGAGPSIAAFAENNLDAVGELLSKTYARIGIPFKIRKLGVHQCCETGDLPVDTKSCCA
jgi:homoserine kinase